MGLHHVVLPSPITFAEKHTLAVVKRQHLADIESDIDPNEEICSLTITSFDGGRKVFVNFKTDDDRLKNVVYRYATLFECQR